MQAKHFLFSPYFDIPLLVWGGKQHCWVYVGISDSHGSQQQQAVSRQYSCTRDVCLSESLSVTHLWNATEKQGSSFCLKPSPFSHDYHTCLFVCFCKIQTNTFILRPFTAVSASLCCGLQWNLALLPGSRWSQSTLKLVISVRKDSIQNLCLWLFSALALSLTNLVYGANDLQKSDSSSTRWKAKGRRTPHFRLSQTWYNNKNNSIFCFLLSVVIKSDLWGGITVKLTLKYVPLRLFSIVFPLKWSLKIHWGFSNIYNSVCRFLLLYNLLFCVF